MKVFISWSGAQSRSVADLLRKYLPIILQGTEPFLSAHDIESGERWGSRLSSELATTNYGLICLTADNLNARWLLFEAGALSKIAESTVCCLLIKLSPTEVSSPLSQFQNKPFDRSSLLTLFHDISKKLEKPLETSALDILFETFWPKIEEEYKKILATPPSPATSKRPDRELLEEILFLMRSLENGPAVPAGPTPLPPNYQMDQLLDQRVRSDTLAAYTVQKFPGSTVSPHIQGLLLRDLKHADYPTVRHIDSAVNRAMPALLAYQKEDPSVFGFGTDYITKALGFVDSHFRGVHGFSQQTRDAFHRLGSLVTY